MGGNTCIYSVQCMYSVLAACCCDVYQVYQGTGCILLYGVGYAAVYTINNSSIGTTGVGHCDSVILLALFG
jgi:hypothetical protein